MKTNSNSRPSTPDPLLPYCHDLQEWPERWMGEEKEPFLPGRRLVEYFMPFLLHLAGSGLSKKTIQNHVDNLWLLGGEIIRDLNNDPSLRKLPSKRPVTDVIHPDGGPLIHNGREDQQTLLRLHLQEVPSLPHPTSALSLPVTHRFPGRSQDLKAVP
jgi:hypothetical protein